MSTTPTGIALVSALLGLFGSRAASQGPCAVRFDVFSCFDETLHLSGLPDLITLHSCGGDRIDYAVGPIESGGDLVLDLPLELPGPTIGFTHRGEFLIADRLAGSGVRLTCLRYELPTKTLVVVDSRVYGWRDAPELLAIVGNRIVAYSRTARRLRVASWIPGTELPDSFSYAETVDPMPDLPAPSRVRVVGTDDCSLHVGPPGDVPSDYQSRLSISFEPGASEPRLTAHRVHQGLGEAPTSSSWDVQQMFAPSTSGPLRVRYGTATETPNLRSGRGVIGRFDHRVTIGGGVSIEARVYGQVFRKTDASAAGFRTATTHLAVGVAAAGSNPTTTSASGAVVIRDPVALLGPNISDLRVQGANHTEWRVVLPALPELHGMDIVFQQVCALPSGEVVTSEVFGTRLHTVGIRP